MSVPARTNAHGGPFDFYDNMVITTTGVKADGTVTTSQVAKRQGVHTCYRSLKGKAWVRPTGTFQIPFRNPTSYDRGIRNAVYHSGVWEKFTPSAAQVYTSVEGQPDLKATWVMLDCPPLQTGNLVNIDTNQRNRARTECLLKLRASSMQLGASLGEARKTHKMLVSRAHDLAVAANDLKHGRWWQVANRFKYRFGKSGRASKNASNLWLEFQYGWKPLMNEISDLVELLDKGLRDKGHIVRASKEVFDTQSFNEAVLYPGFLSSGEGRRSHKCVLYGAISNSNLDAINRAGLSNPASIAWELTRLSFVIDWLVPVGDFLDALTSNWGIEFLGGYDSQHCEAATSTRLLPTGGFSEVTPRGAEMQLFSYRRQRLTSFPAPVPYIKSPFSTTHALSAVALIRQLGFR